MSTRLTFRSLLEEAQENFGRTPRRFGLWEFLSYLWTEPPRWLRPWDKLVVFWLYQWGLLRNGEIVWGHVVQANRLLFQFGTSNCPGEVLYNMDFDRYVPLEELGGVARSVFELKGRTLQDPRAQYFSNYLANERIRVYGIEVPRTISPDFPAAVSTVLFNRYHLPNGRLNCSHFPLLVSRTNPRVAMVLPSKYWPAALREEWLSPGKHNLGD